MICFSRRQRLLSALLVLASAVARADQQTPAADPPAPRDHAAAFPVSRLGDVRDMTSGFLGGERDAYYEILAHARDTSQAAQESLARQVRAFAQARHRARHKGRGFSLFHELIKEPAAYRGLPVRLTGYLRDLTPMEAGDNESGLTQLFQGHLFTEDSLQSPYVVVCQDVPNQMPRPQPSRPTDQVSVVGYFFKIWAYHPERGNWAAPLILAHRLEWHPPAPGWAAGPGTRWGIAAGGCLALSAAGWWLRRQRAREQALRDRLRARFESREAVAGQPRPEEG